MNKEPQAGDTVDFKFKGQKIQGVITRFRVHQQRKLKNMMAHLNLRDDYPTQYEVAEIMVVGKGLYTIPTPNILAVVDRDPVAANLAVAHASKLKAHNNQIKNEVKNRNYIKADEHGLTKLKTPALVYVKYKHNVVRKEQFVGFSPSWQVKIKTPYKTRFISPSFVFANEKDAR